MSFNYHNTGSITVPFIIIIIISSSSISISIRYYYLINRYILLLLIH